jgi:hypothetical protein
MGALLIGAGVLGLGYFYLQSKAMSSAPAAASTAGGTPSIIAPGGTPSIIAPGGTPSIITPGGTISTLIDAAIGVTHASVKLGNLDPHFEPWLATEIDKLVGPLAGAGFRQADRDVLAKAIRGRRLFEYASNPPASSGGLGTLGAIQVGTSLGFQAAAIGLNLAGSAVKAVPILGSIVSFGESIAGIFGAAHAQAVAKEQGTLKQVEPATNAALAQIDQAYKLGQIGGAQVSGYLEQLYTQFVAALAAISHPAAGIEQSIADHTCNAGCTQERQLRGIIDAMVLFDY